jgi:hypothetical protein
MSNMDIFKFDPTALMRRLEDSMTEEESALWTVLVSANVIIIPLNEFKRDEPNLVNMAILTSKWTGDLVPFRYIFHSLVSPRPDGPLVIETLKRLTALISKFIELRVWTSVKTTPRDDMERNDRVACGILLGLYILCELLGNPVEPVLVDGINLGDLEPGVSGSTTPELLSCDTILVHVPVGLSNVKLYGHVGVSRCRWTRRRRHVRTKLRF